MNDLANEGVPTRFLPQFVDALSVHLRKPIPTEDCIQLSAPIQQYASEHYMAYRTLSETSMNAYMAIQCAAMARIGHLVKDFDSSNARKFGVRRKSLAQELIDIWPHARLWLDHLNTYFYNIILPGSLRTPKHVLDCANQSIASFILTFCEEESLQEVIAEDALTLEVVYSTWKRHDLKFALQMGFPRSSTGSPTAVFSRLLLFSMRSHNSKSLNSALVGKERKIVRYATRHLRSVTALNKTAASTKENSLDLGIYVSLFLPISDHKQFLPHLTRQRVITALIEAVRGLVDDVAREGGSLEGAIGLLMSLGALDTLFTCNRGNVTTKSAKGLLDVFASLAEFIPADNTEPDTNSHSFHVRGVIRSIFRTIAELTTTRSVIANVAVSVRNISRSRPSAFPNEVIGEPWKLLRRLSEERAVCRWFYDERRRRRRVTCTNVSGRRLAFLSMS